MFWNTGPKNWDDTPTRKPSFLERLVDIEMEAPAEEEIVAEAVPAREPDRRPGADEPQFVAVRVVEEAPAEEREPEPVIIDMGRDDARKKYFDILERAKEMPDEARREIKIVYTAPKRVYVREDTAYEETPRERTLDVRFDEPARAEEAENPKAIVEEAPEAIAVPAEVAEAVAEALEARADAAEASAISEEASRIGLEAIADMASRGEIRTEPVAEFKEEPVRMENAMGEPMDVQRTLTLEKVLFPDEYFYARDGRVFKNAEHLRRALDEMDEDTFSHHGGGRGVNDFAEWIRHVFRHHECANELDCARRREEMMKVLDRYL